MPTNTYVKSVLAGRHPSSFISSTLNTTLYDDISASTQRANAVRLGTRLKALVNAEEEEAMVKAKLVGPKKTSFAKVKVKPLNSYRKDLLSFSPDPSHAHMQKQETQKLVGLSAFGAGKGKGKMIKKLKGLKSKAKGRKR